MRLAYVVSRFPLASETFILRELNALDDGGGFQISLFALFRPQRAFAHPSAQRWLARLRRPTANAALLALGWWMLRRPLRLIGCAGELLWALRRRPSVLFRALVTLALAGELAREVRRERIEHVHAHFATYPAIAAWVCARLTGVSYSITAHAHDIYVDQSFLANLFAEARFVATISQFNRTFLAPYARDTPVHLVRCGVDPEEYRFRLRELPSAGPVRALCVASLSEYKGHSVLIDALAGSEALARVELSLVGQGELEQQLRAQIERLGLGARVHLLGARSESEVAELLAAADLFVLPSIVASNGQMEGIPVALMEALAAGVPVVTTRISGIPELVQDGLTGVLVEPGDPADLAHGIERVLANAAATRLRAEAGRALVIDEFDAARSAQVLRRLLLAPSAHSSSVSTAAAARL